MDCGGAGWLEISTTDDPITIQSQSGWLSQSVSQSVVSDQRSREVVRSERSEEMVREQVGVIFHWLQDRITRNNKLRKHQAKQQHR